MGEYGILSRNKCDDHQMMANLGFGTTQSTGWIASMSLHGNKAKA